jgi:DNA-binding CsgD family transcriptional regulator
MLTTRELEVVQLIAEGHTNNEIGERLSISGKTVSTHRKNILRKLDMKNTAMLIRYAVEKRWVK